MFNFNRFNQVKLVLLGGARNKEDEAIVQDLKVEAKLLGIQENVIFEVIYIKVL